MLLAIALIVVTIIGMAALIVDSESFPYPDECWDYHKPKFKE